MSMHQTPTWQEIVGSYTSEQATVLGGSRAVVCDINKEMLKVGRQRAKDLGCETGMNSIAPGLLQEGSGSSCARCVGG